MGHTGDICGLDSYTDLLKEIVSSGEKSAPKFLLPVTPQIMPIVYVNGEVISNLIYDSLDNGIIIPEMPIGALVDITIEVTTHNISGLDVSSRLKANRATVGEEREE